jgi:hypothetical protein
VTGDQTIKAFRFGWQPFSLILLWELAVDHGAASPEGYFHLLLRSTETVEGSFKQCPYAKKHRCVYGTTLTSSSAVFTQADAAHQVGGSGFSNATTITAWISPTQVTLSGHAPATLNARTFAIFGRRDGLLALASRIRLDQSSQIGECHLTRRR